MKKSPSPKRRKDLAEYLQARIVKNMARHPNLELSEALTEEEYLSLQKLGDFDTKTSNWLRTPDETRKLGGALFGDRRYGRVFIYHNSASSYFTARGFRASLRV